MAAAVERQQPARAPMGCPVCGFKDSVVKASEMALGGSAAAGRPRGSGSRGDAKGTGSPSAQLQVGFSTKLQLPMHPTERRFTGWAVLGSLGGVAFLAGGSTMAADARGLLSGFAGSPASATVQALSLVGVFLAVLGIGILFSTVLSGRHWTARWRAQYVAQLPAWEAERERWKRMYYCSRCDKVFFGA
jgi:hypothetical protein